MSSQTYIADLPEVRDYWQLLKPRVMSLVTFTAAAGLWLAPGEIHPLLALIAIACIAVNAGAAGALNMWFDRDIDAVMGRTKDRPIPSGRIAPGEALSFGILLSLASLLVMALATNWVAALWLAIANLFYVLVYTVWLKRRTPQNIVIGGAAGAFPPMIGWAAVTGDVTLVPIALFMIIFLWTPPHFWALALYHDVDYGRARIPMLPNVAGARATKWQMLPYTLALIPTVLVPVWFGAAGWIYGAVAVAVSLLFLLSNLRVLQSEEDKPAKQMFGFSILYLFVIFTALIVDRADGVRFAL